MSERPLDAIERILGETYDADAVLRGAVAALVSDPDIAWPGISLVGPRESCVSHDDRAAKRTASRVVAIKNLPPQILDLRERMGRGQLPDRWGSGITARPPMRRARGSLPLSPLSLYSRVRGMQSLE